MSKAPVPEKPSTRLLGDDTYDFYRALTTPPAGLYTGLTDVDNQFGRIYEPGHLIIEAGRPGTGKTVFGLQEAEYHAAEGKNVLVWSLEMSRAQLIRRLVSKHTGISVKELKNREFDDSSWPKIAAAADYITKLPIWCNDLSAATDRTIKSETTALHSRLIEETGQGLAMIVVDYLQLAKSAVEADNREREVAAVADTLRCLAKDLNVPVLALAQLNRDLEKRGSKRPQMSDLGESGSLERHAHTIMFLYRESLYCTDCLDPKKTCREGHEHHAEIIIGKSRDGESGSVLVYFDGGRQMFADLSRVNDKVSSHETPAPPTSPKRTLPAQKTDAFALRNKVFGGSNV